MERAGLAARDLLRPDFGAGGEPPLFCNRVDQGAEPRSGAHGLDFLRRGVSGTAADHVPEEVRQYAAQVFAARPLK